MSNRPAFRAGQRFASKLHDATIRTYGTEPFDCACDTKILILYLAF